jgi:suppressor of ftsI
MSLAVRSRNLNLRLTSGGEGQAHFCRMFVLVCVLLATASAVSAQSNPPFVNPERIEYQGGVVELTAAPARIPWNGTTVNTNAYNAKYNGREYRASYTPPTIRIDPNRTGALNLTLQNRMGKTNLPCIMDHGFTNFHYHGFEVSPVEPGDDVVHIKIKPNESYDYKVEFPQVAMGKTHPEGMFWYHPHPHGCSYAQVNDGLSGALIVGDLLKSRYPGLADIKEQILLLKDGSPTPRGAKKEEANVLALAANPDAKVALAPITVNGLNTPKITIGAGELQFFRIGNVGSNDYVKLALPKVTALIIAVDGMATEKPIALDSSPGGGWILPPGSRVEMIVAGPPKPGTYSLVTRELSGTPSEDQTLAVLEVPRASERELQSNAQTQWSELQNATPAPSHYYPGKEEFAPAADGLSCQYNTPSPDPRYTFVLTREGTKFMINGKTYDENRLDVSCPIPSTPTWTIRNETTSHHPFHIHQIHFRINKVIDSNGKERDVTDDEAPIRDTVDIPPMTAVQITLPFVETYLAGKFVFHCHILAHEDRGMMMNIELHLLNNN